ncbi:alpha/beta hydrolase family protein [Paracidobacterium acidisoli]|uniref:Alpha/beta hydrolase n=1 Tax=Paracidobacterium acidisoli TaxID=2303751 RepID=A0A372IJY2_9BACT|nr:alpha/beta hydrolase [Paracidobacterium acidisoli]MBT9333098.1 alpha/beta hydrolase [Paracidobacterium acidisoli]
MFCRLTAWIACSLLVATAACAQTAQTSDSPGAAGATASPFVAGNLSTTPKWGESWTELSLQKSGLTASAYHAVLLGRYKETGYTRELWRVQWRPNDPVDLYVVLPDGVVKPPVVLYLYDYYFDTERFRSDVWCRQATQGGFAAVGFVSELSGERRHAPRPMKEWFVSNLQETLATTTHDVEMILNYLGSRGDIDVSRAGMYGQGSGGAVAVLAASADPRIVALDLLNPWGDWPDWLKESPELHADERADYLKPQFLRDVSGLDPVSYLPHLKLKALRIQQIMDDPETPAAARERMAAAAPQREDVVQYKDTLAHLNAWRQDGLSGWMQKQLRGTTETASSAR